MRKQKPKRGEWANGRMGAGISHSPTLPFSHSPIHLWLLATGYWLLATGYWLLASESHTPVFAQCAMCRTAASSQGPQAANAMNHAILILLIPAVVIFCGLFLLAYRYRNSSGSEEL